LRAVTVGQLEPCASHNVCRVQTANNDNIKLLVRCIVSINSSPLCRRPEGQVIADMIVSYRGHLLTEVVYICYEAVVPKSVGMTAFQISSALPVSHIFHYFISRVLLGKVGEAFYCASVS
jgi:hypothetical protein